MKIENQQNKNLGDVLNADTIYLAAEQTRSLRDLQDQLSMILVDIERSSLEPERKSKATQLVSEALDISKGKTVSANLVADKLHLAQEIFDTVVAGGNLAKKVAQAIAVLGGLF